MKNEANEIEKKKKELKKIEILRIEDSDVYKNETIHFILHNHFP